MRSDGRYPTSIEEKGLGEQRARGDKMPSEYVKKSKKKCVKMRSTLRKITVSPLIVVKGMDKK
jgi:hypothetical protein